MSKAQSSTRVAVLALLTLIGGPRALFAQQSAGNLSAWTLVFERGLHSGARYEDLAFTDDRNGWMVSSAGDILHTADGGVTWMSQASGLRGLRSIDFLDRERGFAGTLTGKLYSTADGGSSWKDITGMLPATPKGFCGITHVGDKVHLVGRYLGGATDYFFSPDAGRSWQHANLGHLAQGLVDVVFISDDVGFIRGMGKSALPGRGGPVILKTTDGGKTWRSVYQLDDPGGQAWKVFPVSHSVMYASLQLEDGTYRVARSVDSGDTWRTIVIDGGRPHHLWVQGIGFLDERVGFIGGFLQGMYGTTDGGETWSRITLPNSSFNRFERIGRTLITAGTAGVMRFDVVNPSVARSGGRP